MAASRKKIRKVCVVTGSRADYAHLYWLLKKIDEDKELNLQLVATGMHLSKAHGHSYKVIMKDGFKISKKVDILTFANTDCGVTKSVGRGCELFADTFKKLKPDLVVIFGDRFEMMSASLAAYMTRIPIAHIHGGETSQGAMDEAIRHSITKMASIHFPATREYRNRIVQLGEQPKSIFNFGSPSLEGMYRQKMLTKTELEKVLGLNLSETSAIVTYHPATLGKQNPEQQIKAVLNAIRASGINAVFTRSNADAYGDIINRAIKKFCKTNSKKYKFFDFLGHKNYFSCLKHLDVVIGNSSSGLVEAPSFKIPVVNIGDRQRGRVRSKNVIDVVCESTQIQKSIKKALSKSFKIGLKKMRNPYESVKGNRISQHISKTLKTYPLDGEILKKKFYDFK